MDQGLHLSEGVHDALLVHDLAEPVRMMGHLVHVVGHIREQKGQLA